MNEFNEIIDFLGSIQKPLRYLGGEKNVIIKKWSETPYRIALLFPEPYELAQSNLGISIIYHLLNREKDFLCERVFLPWEDFSNLLKEKDISLSSIENRMPLKEFDVIGISLQSEVSYTNVLHALSLAKIPILSSERDNSHPIILGGGPCTVNPLPLNRFLDAFAIGDGEILVNEIVEALRKFPRECKRERLEALDKSMHFYLPSRSAEKIVRYAVTENLSREDYPSKPLVPILETTHDRLNIEIMRGCLRGCRFCQAGFINRPKRERAADDIIYLMEQGIKNSGWEDLSLSSLSSTDYSLFNELSQAILPYCTSKRISLSLPSIRGDNFDIHMLKSLALGKHSGLTFAPEAGTERLRNVINKTISNSDIIRVVDMALKNQWKTVKLYFMIGLPTETIEDIEGIAELSDEIAYMARRHNALVNINLGIFIPKPHTPFQWMRFSSREEIKEKTELLFEKMPRHAVKIKWPVYEESLIEAVLARGDERVSALLLSAYNNGEYLTGWSEFFDFTRWDEACTSNGLSWDELSRGYTLDEKLPWSFINCNTSEKFLRNEYEKAIQGLLTPPCNQDSCNNCGACSEKTRIENSSPVTRRITIETTSFGRQKTKVALEKEAPSYRVHYTKSEHARFASHLDMGRIFDRLFRQFSIPVDFSEGYTPRPKFSFGPPLPLGIESLAEYFDFQAKREVPIAILKAMLMNINNIGIEIEKVGRIARNAPSLMKMIQGIDYFFNLGSLDENEKRNFKERIADIRNPAAVVTKVNVEGKKKEININKSLKKFSINNDDFVFTLVNNETNYLNPILFIEYLIGRKTMQIKKISVNPDPFSRELVIES